MKLQELTGTLFDGKIRSKTEFSENDRKLDFRCPKFREGIIPRFRKTRNQSYFAHKPETDCVGGQESAYHLMAKEVLEENKSLYLSEYSFDLENEPSFWELNKEHKIYNWVIKYIDKCLESVSYKK